MSLAWSSLVVTRFVFVVQRLRLFTLMLRPLTGRKRLHQDDHLCPWATLLLRECSASRKASAPESSNHKYQPALSLFLISFDISKSQRSCTSDFWTLDRMNIVLMSSLLGVFTLQVTPSEATLKVSVSVWPPGSKVFVGECVLLRCSVESSSGFVWGYRWFKHKPALTPSPTWSPRHRASGDSYSIAAVTREDAGGYRCRAERQASNATLVTLLSEPAVLSVTVPPPPASLLTLSPSSRQLFGGERFTARCPSGWLLRRCSEERRALRTTQVLHADRCSPLGGDVTADGPDECAFTAGGESGGLYWCEGAEGRSNAVNVTVSYGSVILRTPSHPVFEGDEVVLYCQYRTGNHRNTTFFKNGAEVATNSSSSSDGGIKMTIENVTRDDEGYYKCASSDREVESPESWLSVRPDPGLNFTSTDGTAASTSGARRFAPVAVGPLPKTSFLKCRFLKCGFLRPTKT